ncbi:MAG TPA: glycosyltransferase family 4 protein [Rhizomicrobium sp.]|jgi:glycosyltransferase involved in cell wall biosynthesis|nr:glycosyltransferase family 4 protein [Rhizomicrobium sp.]
MSSEPTNAAPLLLHVFPTFAVGGSQARLAALANRFGSKYRHAIVAMDGAYDCFERLCEQVVAERWIVPSPKRNTFGNMRAFRRILAARRPDLLITYNWGAIEWALANRPHVVPHIHIEDGFGPEETHGQLFRRVFTRRLALAKSIVVLPSRTLYRLALDKWRLPADRVRHIPNGIDVARFRSVHAPVPLPGGAGPVIGTVAALRPEKNIPRLLRAFRTLREKMPCRLVIAGDGPERVALELLAAQTLPANSFAFLGHISSAERVYAALHIFALPSDTEQMPTSLMEAMAAGLPVIATDVGDVREMVSVENRPYVVPRDDELFSAVLFGLAGNASLRAAIGDHNRLVAEARFGIGHMTAAYDSLFETLSGCRQLRSVN